MPTFKEALRELINKYSMEQTSNTPDFILADYLDKCLETFDEIVNQREAWYGREPKPPKTL